MKGSTLGDSDPGTLGMPHLETPMPSRKTVDEKHPKDGLAVIPFTTPAELEAWLETHHAASPGIWLKLAKKGSGVPSINWEEAVEAALCFGWIDGQRQSRDATYFLQRLTPRSKRSIWSKVNTEKVAALIASDRMRLAGLAEVDRAKADGRWETAYAAQSKAEVPEDLQAFLDAHPDAAAFFATLTSQNRFAFLFRLHNAKKPETRARRFAEFTRMLSAGETFY
jgi:uncharacterized protein YdeI (YjbR/CyaY-like superfamily)